MDIDYLENDNSDCDEDSLSCSSCGAMPNYYRALETAAIHTHPTNPRPEVKFRDIQLAPSVTSTGTVICVNQQVGGTINTQHNGNQITVQSVSWNFIPNLPPANTTSPAGPGVTRMSLIWDRQPNGVLPVYSDIYNNFQFTFAPLSHLSVGNRQRFVVLKQFIYPSPLNGSVNYETGKLRIDMISTYENGNSNPIPITGAVLFVVATNSTTPINLQGVVRLRYCDN